MKLGEPARLYRKSGMWGTRHLWKVGIVEIPVVCGRRELWDIRRLWKVKKRAGLSRQFLDLRAARSAGSRMSANGWLADWQARNSGDGLRGFGSFAFGLRCVWANKGLSGFCATWRPGLV